MSVQTLHYLKVSLSLHDHCLCLCLKLQENGKDGVLAPQVGCSVQRIFVGAWSRLAVIPFETTTDNMPERTHVP